MTDVPPARQCVRAECTREATDPERPGSLCEEHLSAIFSESDGEEPDPPGVNPGGETVETALRRGNFDAPEADADTEGAIDADAATDALEDVLRFYNQRVDDTIADHTDEGDHPERPTTAREYFTDVRGWDEATVDNRLLGWAPPDHTDQLVEYLHRRGHSREAMLATGLLGDREDGTLYTTWSARYVLPYFDADGRPAYAIARVTGGTGGGGRDYGGHPDDYQAGKYAKLRHTDDRVPFDEPIYGLGTLEDGEHVVVAEGIADAITARELGYSVLSPVAKEFKEAHYGPLAEALETHDIERVTIVADHDETRNDGADELDPDTIRGAVGGALAEVGAGLGGALRTAEKLGDRVGLDIRLALPPAPGDLTSDLDEFVTGAWGGDLAALLASAKPPAAYVELEAATSAGGSAVRSDDVDRDEFDAEEYDPEATDADETTDDVRDLFHALDQLDAQRVADRTIVREWLDDRGERRAFAPTWARSDYTGTANFVDSDKWVDTGTRGGSGGPAAMAAIDVGLVEDTACPRAVEGETWFKAVDHLRDLGFAIPKLEDGDVAAVSNAEEYREDPRDLFDIDVVVEPTKALAAAGAVEPDDLDRDLPELKREDVDDVAIAVALAEGRIDSPQEFPDDGGYTDAYYRARDHYGAPLPKFLDNTTLEHRDDLVFAALERVEAEHVLGATQSEVTVEDPPGVALAKLDPTWEDSERGERILAGYGRGFYCVKHEASFSPIQLVALEHGLIDSETEYPHGEAFKQAYRLLREEYGAPLPKWRATILEHVAILPPAVRLLDDDLSARAGTDSLAEARERTEALVRDALGVRDRAQLVTAAPGTGKSYSSVLEADDNPGLYTTRRNELKAQAEDYAHEISEDQEDHPDADPSVLHLPILAENVLPDPVKRAGVAAIREHGRDLLREDEALLEHVEDEFDDQDDSEADAAETADGDEVDLDRATCPVGEGEFGLAWQVRIQVARALELKPGEIHARDVAIFGEPLPCQHDDHAADGECEFTQGWECVRDPDNPVDLLIGSPEHAYVNSATTYFTRDRDGDRVEETRWVVIDEFPEEAYFDQYGEQFMDHAVWLAEALVGVDSREDLLDAGLHSDTWVDHWLDGDGEEVIHTAVAIEALEAAGEIAEASDKADEVLDRGRLEAVKGKTAVNLAALRDALAAIAAVDPAGGAGLDTAADTLGQAANQLGKAADRAYADGRDVAGTLYALVDDVEAILDALTHGFEAVDHGGDGLLAAVTDRVDALPAGGDLASLLEAALDAVQGDAPAGILDAAVTALRGGRDGCRELALWAADGYAHPDAWALLAGAIAKSDQQGVSEVREPTFAFDREVEGGVFKRLTKNDATVVADKNHHGAIVVDTPAFTHIDGTKCPVLGLDATGRTELWRLAIGRDVERRDIHETDADRRRFLREIVNLRVIQTTEDPLAYHSAPDGKNFQEDMELVETVAAEYTGRGPDAVDDKAPAVISTKKVLTHLEEQDELGDHAGATVNYEGMKGSDALADHQVAVLLGSQHYSDKVPEKWALLAGEEAGRGDTRGASLDYDSNVANAYLRYMREDHCMQAALRVGRNDEDTVVVAHTSALRDDLPVVDEGTVVSAHSQGTLAVVEAAAEFRHGPFTAQDILDAIEGDDRAVGLRQVQNVLADLRGGGYLRTVTEPDPGRAGEYEFEEDPGQADVELPDVANEVPEKQSEKTRIDTYNTWDFALGTADADGSGLAPPSRPVIPAGETAASVADGVDPGG